MENPYDLTGHDAQVLMRVLKETFRMQDGDLTEDRLAMVTAHNIRNAGIFTANPNERA